MWKSTYRRLISTAVLLGLLLGPLAAPAQPMMMDPAQMSGIPRPDGQVPTGTVTVRLIRGELQNRIVDAAVELLAVAAPTQSPRFEKTDAQGRATFSDLPVAVYQARATVNGQTLVSQPIEVAAAPAPGMRVMLVFAKPAAETSKSDVGAADGKAQIAAETSKGEVGAADGKARVAADAAAGSLLVKAVDVGGQPLAGLRVVIGYARRAAQKVEVLAPKATAADGTVQYTGLETGTELGYMASIQRAGREHRSQPFHLEKDHGSVLVLTVPSVALDIGALHIAQGSHIIFDPQDDMLHVVENLILENPLPQPVDPGPAGLRLPLPVDALSPQISPESPPALSIDVTTPGAPAAVYKGLIAPGRTMLDVSFILKHHGQLVFRQAASLPYEGLRIGVVKLKDLQVEGLANVEERKLSGRDFLVGAAVVPSSGGIIEVTLQGLPSDFYILRILAALGALSIAGIFAYLSIFSRNSEEEDAQAQRQRQKLLNRREALLSELLSQESNGAARPKSKARSPEAIRAELETVYRTLDESDG